MLRPQVPIGILESDFGGSSITQWLPPATLQQIGGVPLQETDPTQVFFLLLTVISILHLL